MAGDETSTLMPRFSSSIAIKRAFNRTSSSSIDILAGALFSEAASFEGIPGDSEYAGAGVGQESRPI